MGVEIKKHMSSAQHSALLTTSARQMLAVMTLRPAMEGLGAGPLVNSSPSEEVCEEANFPDQDSQRVASDVAAWGSRKERRQLYSL